MNNMSLFTTSLIGCRGFVIQWHFIINQHSIMICALHPLISDSHWTQSNSRIQRAQSDLVMGFGSALSVHLKTRRLFQMISLQCLNFGFITEWRPQALAWMGLVACAFLWELLKRLSCVSIYHQSLFTLKYLKRKTGFVHLRMYCDVTDLWNLIRCLV